MKDAEEVLSTLSFLRPATLEAPSLSDPLGPTDRSASSNPVSIKVRSTSGASNDLSWPAMVARCSRGPKRKASIKLC